MICEICGLCFTTISNLNQHQREQHKDNVDCYKCSYCQRLFLRTFNLKRHLLTVHQTSTVEEEMDHKRRRVDRGKYEEMQKPVYVLSHLYDDISSDEEFGGSMNNLIDSDDLEEISVHSADLDFVDELFRDSDSVCDERNVVNETDEIKDTREVIVNSDTDSESDSTSDPTDENNNRKVTKTTICLVMNRTVRRAPCGTEEISRDSQIIYSEDLDPKDIDFASVAIDILNEVPRHFNVNM